ncbi:hypothetical protein [Lacticaseibacillus mingshuiensis]|uniref:Uncharacterized protein n=1 Tax=Lacticaseibacillus mingshuiensis TaxID=2799574 RepID=A0ABW4CEP6_9LACO|nr:hypothetical protein [Lacticaseibacillus mingshuiensis]
MQFAVSEIARPNRGISIGVMPSQNLMLSVWGCRVMDNSWSENFTVFVKDVDLL